MNVSCIDGGNHVSDLSMFLDLLSDNLIVPTELCIYGQSCL